MQFRFIARAVAGMLLVTISSASAQLTPTQINKSGILGAGLMDRVTQGIANKIEIGDKDHPLKVELADGVGTIYEFKVGTGYVMVIVGKKPMDVAVLSDLFTVNSYVAVVSKNDASLAPTDFPAEVQEQVRHLWPSGKTQLRPESLLLRAEPSGELLGLFQGFVGVSDFKGTTVMEFQKTDAAVTAGLIAYGTVSQPFGMDLTLVDPQFFFTKKGTPPKRYIALASKITVSGHEYTFMAEAWNPRAPEVFLLKTKSMDMQDIANLAKAFSKPLFNLAPGTDPKWNLKLIPTISLRPVTGSPPSGFGIVDHDNVIIYAAQSKPSSSEWNLTKVPGITVRGALRVDLLDQSPANVSLEADKGGFEETISLGTKLPKSDLSFGAVTETIRIATDKSSIRISAESPDKCFQQKLSFEVDSKGNLSPSLNAGETASSLEPTAFYGNLKGCASLTVATAKWALETGVKVLGFAGDKALDAASLVVGSAGANVIGTAARDIGYPASEVSKALGKVMNKDDLLNLGEKLYPDKLVAFAAGAGYGAVDVMHWTHAFSKDADAIGRMFKDSGVDKDTFLNAANTVWPWESIGKIARGAGYGATDLYHWAWAFHVPLAGAGIMNAGAFFKDDVLGGAQTVWGSAGQLSNEGVAELGRTVGYSASEVKDWFWQYRTQDKKEIVRLLRAGGYAKDHVKDMAKSAWDWSSGTADDTWSKAKDTVGGWIPKRWW